MTLSQVKAPAGIAYNHTAPTFHIAAMLLAGYS